jgi:hypothetical protein
LEFSKNSYQFYNLADLQTKNEKGGSQRGPRVFAQRPLEQEKKLQMCPCQLSTVTARSVRHVLAGGEVSGGEGQAQHGLRDRWCLLVGDVLEEQWWSMAGGKEWRRPWRRAHVPGEGPVNVDEQGAHKHRGDVGV